MAVEAHFGILYDLALSMKMNINIKQKPSQAESLI